MYILFGYIYNYATKLSFVAREGINSDRRQIRMIIYKISLGIAGSIFNPKIIKLFVKDKLYIESLLEIGDFWRLGNGKKIISKTNSIGIQHKDLIAKNNEELVIFEKIFVNFLYQNCNEIKKAGADSIEIDYNIYTSENICSLSIFNTSQLKILTNCDISINLTYYKMKKKKIKEIWDI